MRLKNLYKIFGLAVLAFILQSRSAGPAGVASLQVTGAPGSSGAEGTCANPGCHAAGAFDPSMSLELLSADGSTPIDEYVPGETYTLRFAMTAGTGTPDRYGFQAVVLDAGENDVSDWGVLPGGMQTVSLGGRNYLEHSTPTSFDTWDVEWIAPAEGTGAVTFYSAGIASNNNGNTSGDGTASNSLMIAEGIGSSLAEIEKAFAAITIAPNPIQDLTQVAISSQVSGNFQLNITDASGRTVFSEKIDLQKGLNQETLSLGDLQSGYYSLQLIGAEYISSKPLLKL